MCIRDRAWLDGEFLGRKREGNTTISTLNLLRLGVQYADDSTFGKVYIDNWKIASEYIGVVQESLDISSVPIDNPQLLTWVNIINPYKGLTKIEYNLKNPARVMISIFQLQGEKVKQLVNTYQKAGQHWTFWDGKNEITIDKRFIVEDQGIYSNIDLYLLNPPRFWNENLLKKANEYLEGLLKK